MDKWAGYGCRWAGHNQHVGGAVYVKQLSSDEMGKFLCSQWSSVVCKTMLETVLDLKHH